MKSALRWLVPSYGAILFLTALVNVLVLRAASLFATDGDGARHLRLGHEILRQGAIPKVDMLSHTREGAPIVLHEWLSEVLLALADTAAGLSGVAVLTAFLFAIGVLAVYKAADELGATRPLALAGGVLALLLQSIHLLPRPHLFTTAFAAAYLVLLVRFARTGRRALLAPLPPLMLVWANTHGGFLLGITLVAAFLVGALLGSREFVAGRRAAKPLGVTLVVCLAATLLTPAGAALWAYTVGHLGTDRLLIAITHEFQSVDFHQGYGKLFFLALFAAPALWMTGRVRVTWLGAGLYLFFAASALHSARNIPLFALIVLPWLAVWTKQALEAGGETAGAVVRRMKRMDEADRRLRPWGWAAGVFGIVAGALGPWATLYQFGPAAFPVRAVENLDRRDTTGPVFNQMHWGGYLLYTRPDIPVFIDGQTDFYGEALSREYLAALLGGPEWREVLNEHGVTWTLIATGEPLVQLLDLAPEWQRIYEDGVATIHRRREPVP